MCRMAELKTANGTALVAAHKADCVSNIVSLAKNTADVSRIILFGSATGNRCRKNSDIDIAVLGRTSKAKMLKSKAYKEFVRDIRHFNKIQNYDILYFSRSQFDKMLGGIKDEINNGVVIYDREAAA